MDNPEPTRASVGRRTKAPTVARARREPTTANWSEARRYSRAAVVVSTERLTATGTVRLTFSVDDGQPLHFDPGEFIGVRANVPGLGVRHSPYCLLSPPATDGRFDLLVRVVPEGPVACYLGELLPGDTMTFRGPTGRSMVPHDPTRHVVMLATGVGIAPFYSLARHLADTGASTRVTLYWGLRLRDDICLIEELDDLARSHPDFTYFISLSEPDAQWGGLRGRLTESVPSQLMTLGQKHFLLCGNGAMTQEFGVALSDLGVADEFIHAEPYFNRQHRPAPEVLDEIRDRFSTTDLFSPYAHQQTELFHVERPIGNADPNAPSDVARYVPTAATPEPGSREA